MSVKTSDGLSSLARACVAQGGSYHDEGSGSRAVTRTYLDPVDEIWLQTAHRLGMRVARSDEVFASWDGSGVLTLSRPRGFDPDDCLAQMILHELAHALVQGPHDWSATDWGLHNADDRDLAAEYAAQRVQAALAAPHGLRRFMGVTTQWRAYYDALPEDPLEGPASDPAVRLARAGFMRSRRPPWRETIDAALGATAAVARVLQPFARPDSLWAVACGEVEPRLSGTAAEK
ncbi:MAG: hypothetical protein CL927_11180 [Deltaproteobacteria bacterium]|nr:hypothetical protein [Deltaproteobacteria bacterium]HCH64141.1 hypothetical protein [Deltaproteobacteria bacterium]